MTISRLQESLFRLSPVRLAVALVFFCRGGLFLAAGRLYRGLGDLSWIVRVSNVAPIQRLAYALIAGKLAEIRKSGRNALVESYRADPASSVSAARYSLTGAGPRDLLRDVIVLKRFRPGEKGVLLLKYAQTFDAVFSMFDIARLTERYVFVLEPCWAGYCDPSILMFVAPGDPVIVQCFTEQDFRFIEGLGAPFVPVRLGPADWVDADLFKPTPAPKAHDLVMVANWAPHKRHAQLFRALEEIRNRDVRVLLIGFPWAGRTADDIRREASAIRNTRVQIEIREQLPPAEVARSVGQSKAFVFLSRKEGDNKALVEAMFADVPAIVFDETIGGAKSRLNAATGMLASDDELPQRICEMLDSYDRFAPRAWALSHTGSAVATTILNDTLKRAVLASGGSYTESVVEKTNAPNLAYKDPACRVSFANDYDFILSCRLEPSRAKAVA